MSARPDAIRNFCIIAHIDHGKSTLADRFLELTGTVAKREMQEQLLDSMDIERERGITVKLAPVRMQWKGIELNLIDTPGHVDFAYEVSRSLEAVEGAILVVDATQGIEAQTIANLTQALEANLTIIPVINKIDLPAADVQHVTNEIVHLLGCDPSEVLPVSAKLGTGVPELLDRIVATVPPPQVSPTTDSRALIFDSVYDEFQGVIAFVRVVDGRIKRGDPIRMLATSKSGTVLEVGRFTPKRVTEAELGPGEIGYVVTGLKDLRSVRVGDTIATDHAAQALPGYREVKPMVFAGIFTQEGDDYPRLRDALDKLRLNDASLVFDPEHSPALGYGFRCGFLGLLHLDIVQERLKREYGLNLIVTVPSVAYNVAFTDGRIETVHSPLDLDDPSKIKLIEEPIMTLDVVCPADRMGPTMQFISKRRAVYRTTEYLDQTRVILHYDIPLTSLLVDFYDTLKSVSAGYASMNYEFVRYEPADVVRLDILVATEPVDALSSLVYRDEAHQRGRSVAERLKGILPRQMFEVKIQAAIGGKIVASETIPAMRKDVTAKLYGGDVTRKRKLLEKQKKGKKRMKALGKVDIPAAAFLAVLKR
ncbi:MAG: elongation factor 4 [Candidatus Kerfeldbacteria bacterium]|nr:elongation factor 4 [Candidatus Kerfeldbacteria bacterium]